MSKRFIDPISSGPRCLVFLISLIWLFSGPAHVQSQPQVADLRKTLSHHPPEAAVQYIPLYADSEGKMYQPAGAARIISASSNAPVFGLFDTHLGDNGIVGGSLLDQHATGQSVVLTAVDILQGKLPTRPLTILPPSLVPMVDWLQMKRWGFSESALPADAMILNKPVSPWERYTLYIIGGLALCVLQSLLIAGLLPQRRRRKAAEEDLDQFFNISLDLLCIANTEGYFLRLNPAWERILGYSREELVAKQFLDFVHPGDWDRTREAISALASQQKVVAFENRYRCKDGTYRWLEWNSAPTGRLIYAAARDITARKQTEEALEERLKFEMLLAELSAHFVNLPVDRIDGEVEDAQRRICELLDLDRSPLFQVPEREPGTLLLTHVYQPPGRLQRPGRLNAGDLFPWTTQKLLDGETVTISKMTDLPPEADRDRENFRAVGTTSGVYVPLSVGKGPVFGLLGFAVMREERSWPETVVKGFKLIAQVFANALARKRAEQGLRESEARLSMATIAAGAGLWIMEPNLARVWVTPKTRELFHFSPDEELNYESFFKAVHPEDRGRVNQAVQRALQSGENLHCDYRVVQPDRTIRWIAARGQRFLKSTGEPDRMMGLSLDITERKQAEEALEERLSFERLLSGLSARFVNIPPDQVDSEIEDGLRKILEFFQVDRCALIRTLPGKTSYQITHVASSDDVPPFSAWGELPRSIYPWAYEKLAEKHEVVSISRLDDLPAEANTDRQTCLEWGIQSYVNIPILIGESVDHIINVSSVKRERVWSEELFPRLRLLGEIFVNALERKRAETEAARSRTELLHLERSLRLSELTASLAHELNQPLAAILSNAQAALRFLKSEKPDLNEFQEILRDIISDDQRAGDVIRSLRSMMKWEEGEKTSTLLNDILNDVIHIFRSEAIFRNVHIETEFDGSLPPVFGDKGQLQQVVLNLIMNGAEAMSSNPSGQRKLILRTQRKDHSIWVTVRDFGPGIDEDSLERVFQPFFTTKGTGLGMGLAVCSSIIKAHRGRIWAENNPDGGATFIFELPVIRGPLTGN